MASATLYALLFFGIFTKYPFQFIRIENHKHGRMKRSTDVFPTQLLEPFKHAARKEIQESHNSFDKEPMSRLMMSCKNKAYKKILSDFPFAEMRWEYKGDNFSLQPSRMTSSLTSITIQNLIPEDSGVYHCLLTLGPSKTSITVAVFSVVVGNETKYINKGDSLILDCHGKELGILFKHARRLWKDQSGKKHFEKLAADISKDVIKSVDDKSAGIWTCQVEDRGTGRIWKTARVKIAIKPALSGVRQLIHYSKTHKTETVIAMFAATFMLVLVMNCLTKLVEKRQSKIKSELEEIQKVLGINKDNLEGDTVPLLLEVADQPKSKTDGSKSSTSSEDEST